MNLMDTAIAGAITGIVGVLFLVLNLAIYAVVIAVICAVVWMFLAAGGIVPPIDLVPFIPYV